MVDLLPAAEVRRVMRTVFGGAAGVNPDRITDAALLREPPPPADNLNLSADDIPALIMRSAGQLLGAKLTAMFAEDIVHPDAAARKKFGPLADLLQAHFNSLALSAAFVVICDALLRDPKDVTIATPITHIDQPGRLTFLMRTTDAIRARICVDGGFEFTQMRGNALMEARKVETAMDVVIGGLKDARVNNRCF